jgi:hypothetical protein
MLITDGTKIMMVAAKVVLAPVLLLGLAVQSANEGSTAGAWAWAGSNDWFGPAIVGWAILAEGYLELVL